MYINDIKAHYGNNYLMLRHHLSSCKVNPKISRILVLNVILIFSFDGIIHGWRIAQAVNFPDTNIMFNSTKKNWLLYIWYPLSIGQFMQQSF